jgi:hypothetical protein
MDHEMIVRENMFLIYLHNVCVLLIRSHLYLFLLSVNARMGAPDFLACQN